MSSRRDFLKKSAFAAVGLGVCSSIPSYSSDRPKGNKDTNLARITEGGSADIIVAGGGPAGIAAAITAARCGKKVILLELNGCLGGIWTSGLMCCMMDFGKCEIGREITRRLDEMGARVPRRATMLDSNYLFEPEYMKLILEQMCEESGVRFLLHTRVSGVEKSGKKIKSVLTESKSGIQRWTAKMFIDATGDGDLAERAGCAYDFGGVYEGDNDQPATMNAICIVDDDTKLQKFLLNEPSSFDEDGNTRWNAKKNTENEVKRCGSTADYPRFARLRPNLLTVSATHEYALRVDDAEAVTKATVRSRRALFEMTQALIKNGGDAWSGLRIVATADQIGHRAARRIHGRYKITIEDAVAGRKFPDAVALSKTHVDVHAQKKNAGPHADLGYKIKPFEIPFRACQAEEIDNLYMVGRCISGDFLSMASYRISGCAVEMGENVAKKLCSGK